MTPDERARWTRVGELSALALVLGYLETFVPIPVPGVKLGLANIAVLVALDDGDIAGAFCVGAIKVLAVGLLFGNPLTMAYSILGTLLAFAVMAPLSKVPGIHIVLVSVAGALAHITGQVIVAMVLLGTPLVWYSFPLLEVLAMLTGALCGVVTARALTARDSRDQMAKPAVQSAGLAALQIAQDTVRPSGEGTGLPAARSARGFVQVSPKAALLFLIAFMLVVFNVRSTALLAACMALAVVGCVLGRTSPRALLQALRPLLLILVITFFAQVASFQQGAVAVQLGPLAVTDEALHQTWIMFARLVSVTGASVAIMQLVELPDLVGAIRWLTSPLMRLGVRTEGFCLALEVALASVPVVLDLAKRQSWNWKDLRFAAPGFIAEVLSCM